MNKPTITLHHINDNKLIEINPKYIIKITHRYISSIQTEGSWVETPDNTIGVYETREKILKLIEELPNNDEQILELLIEINHNIKELTNRETEI